ncbi:MAG: helix-hairpin-helix domain-containing protein [Chloroflexota bacterium]
MDTSRLETLAAAAQFDVCGYSGLRSESDLAHFLYRSTLPDGRPVCLFKVLLTNVCVNDCAYCVNQVGRDCPRSTMSPDELARAFMGLHARNVAHGLFLSSGIAGSASRTMESMIAAVEILRRHYQYRGYVHLKILPGATLDCVEEACKLANRVSVNMEAPTVHHLARLSSKKDLHSDILERMRWVKRLAAADEKLVPSGQTTQFVVGAAGETDREILSAVSDLYREMQLRRVYFSAFRPVSRSRLEGIVPTSPMREHRLYQADWLMRVYGFPPHEVELALGKKGELSLRKDPKSIIALKQPWLFPVDVNRANYEQLLRVPGIGPVSARRITEARRQHSIFSTLQLKKMGVVIGQAVPFIWFQGLTERPKQQSFLGDFEDSEAALPEPSLAGAVT